MHAQTSTATTTSTESTATRPTKATSARSRRLRTIANPVEEYLIVHQAEGHSPKTLEWHRTALGLLVRFLEAEEGVTDPHDFDTGHLRRWVVWLASPESVARRRVRTSVAPRSKRTVHTYTRSAHAFCKWLFDGGYTDADVTDHFTLPKFGKPLIKILEEEDFQQLLAAREAGQHPKEYGLRDGAMLWMKLTRFGGHL